MWGRRWGWGSREKLFPGEQVHRACSFSCPILVWLWLRGEGQVWALREAGHLQGAPVAPPCHPTPGTAALGPLLFLPSCLAAPFGGPRQGQTGVGCAGVEDQIPEWPFVQVLHHEPQTSGSTRLKPILQMGKVRLREGMQLALLWARASGEPGREWPSRASWEQPWQCG